MHKCDVRRLAKIKTIKFFDDILMQRTGLQEIDQLFIKCSLRIFARVGLATQIDKKNRLVLLA